MSSLFAFPGQGAQKPGMLHRLPDEPQIAAALAEAGEVLGEDALALDSAEALQSTRAVQLCLLIAGVAGARLLMRDGLRPDYVAGLSIGAYPAAVTAGALAFADAVRLVALRGELMQRAYPQGYGMTALSGLDPVRETHGQCEETSTTGQSQGAGGGGGRRPPPVPLPERKTRT